MNLRAHARRLFGELDRTLADLGNRLFEATEGEYLGVDPEVARLRVPDLVRSAWDCLAALANLAPVAHGFRPEVDQAVLRAKKDAFETVELPGSSGQWAPDEPYRVMLELPDLARRMRMIYGLDAEPDALAPFEPSQRVLIQMAREVGMTIGHLRDKGVMLEPEREDHIKHVMFATVAAAFPGTLPDGKIKFARVLKSYKPDLGVPQLKTCVELKVARDHAALAKVLDEVTVDISAYGSRDYTSFVSIIYTDNPELTQDQIDVAIEQKLEILGADPKYMWGVFLARGPIQPPKKRAMTPPG